MQSAKKISKKEATIQFSQTYFLLNLFFFSIHLFHLCFPANIIFLYSPLLISCKYYKCEVFKFGFHYPTVCKAMFKLLRWSCRRWILSTSLLCRPAFFTPDMKHQDIVREISDVKSKCTFYVDIWQSVLPHIIELLHKVVLLDTYLEKGGYYLFVKSLFDF